jgi:putative flippase GtrA
VITILLYLPFKFHQFLLFSLVGGISAILGGALLYFFVETVGLPENWAYFTQLMLILQFNFNFNDSITWGANRHKTTCYIKRWAKFHFGRGISLLGSQMFFMAATELNMPYMLAYACDSAFWLCANYIVGKKWVFK